MSSRMCTLCSWSSTHRRLANRAERYVLLLDTVVGLTNVSQELEKAAREDDEEEKERRKATATLLERTSELYADPATLVEFKIASTLYRVIPQACKDASGVFLRRVRMNCSRNFSVGCRRFRRRCPDNICSYPDEFEDRAGAFCFCAVRCRDDRNSRSTPPPLRGVRGIQGAYCAYNWNIIMSC